VTLPVLLLVLLVREIDCDLNVHTIASGQVRATWELLKVDCRLDWTDKKRRIIALHRLNCAVVHKHIDQPMAGAGALGPSSLMNRLAIS